MKNEGWQMARKRKARKNFAASIRNAFSPPVTRQQSHQQIQQPGYYRDNSSSSSSSSSKSSDIGERGREGNNDSSNSQTSSTLEESILDYHDEQLYENTSQRLSHPISSRPKRLRKPSWKQREAEESSRLKAEARDSARLQREERRRKAMTRKDYETHLSNQFDLDCIIESDNIDDEQSFDPEENYDYMDEEVLGACARR